MKKKILTAAALTFALGFGGAAQAAPAEDIPSRDFSFDGIFGTFDYASAQRGLQVLEQACMACHSMELVPFYTLEGIGYTEEEVLAIAEQYNVEDGPDDRGNMFERPGRATDTIPDPYPNEQAARAANQGAYPPDLSVITKAREGGPEYLYALLTGYTDPPPGVEVGGGLFWNEHYSGNQIAMPPPLTDGMVDYQDGTEATVSQMSHDVTMFLHFAAEPHMEARKRMGIKVILFLIVFTGLLYAVKRRIWQDLH